MIFFSEREAGHHGRLAPVPWIRVIAIERKTVGFIVAILVLSAISVWAGYTIYHATTPVRIGVLLPLTGDIELREPLEWARENINRGGGVGGRPVELVYRDTTGRNVTELAREFLRDDSIRIVIGPPASDDVYVLAPLFRDQKKILISPLATSGDIIRAFGRTGYFWRTTQGDVAQVKIILMTIREKGGSSAALLTVNSTYGRTFYDWTGFYATEYGFNLTSINEFEPGTPRLDAYVAEALRADPDYLIAACGPEDAVVIKRALDRAKSRTRLFLADGAVSPVLTSSLGPAAEGIEGTSPTADPTTGFTVAYREKFGHPPADYAALSYDALLLAAYTTARQDAVFFESPDDSVRHVVYGDGKPRGWDAQEAAEAIRELRAGGSPGVTGASGPLEYDAEFGVDPLITWYSTWVVEKGSFLTVSSVNSEKGGVSSGKKESASRARASALNASVSRESGTGPVLSDRTGFRAVLLGPSSGWKNYRHESDVLAVYAYLRGNGIPDDHIILILYDDIPRLAENPIAGDVHNTPRGVNLRSGAVVDYSGSQVSAATFRQVLSGNRSRETPVVLESNATTDLFVYIASHGVPGRIVFDTNNDSFTAADLAAITDDLGREKRYRQMALFVDTCFGESMATGVRAPGVYFLTGAAKNEPSLGAVYDPDIRQWLSDEFTATVFTLIRSDPEITFRELHESSYERVTGSHVRMKNTGNFSMDIPVREYLKP